MKKLFKQESSGDRLIILTDRTRKDYEEALFLREDDLTPRISYLDYLDGVLTFMSLGKNHERTAETIATLINFLPFASCLLTFAFCLLTHSQPLRRLTR